MKNLRVAVIGAGKMGMNHLRVYSALKNVDLVAVVDSDKKRAEAAARQFNCKAFTKMEELVGIVDAVSVAAPSSLHAEIGAFVMSKGIHCLMEKPLATTREDCQKLIDVAAKNKIVLMVGHVERFNPAVRQLASILNGEHAVHAIDARRMSFASSRISDVDVVADLMVHDLDIILYLTGFKLPVKYDAHGVRTGGGKGEDYVTAMLSFDNGAIATITGSRITQNKIRTLHVTSDIGFVTLDYIAQEILIHKQKAEPTQTAQGSYVFDLQTERVLVRTAEPLMQELQHFVECVQTGATPLVTGQHGLAALEVVWKIQQSIKDQVHVAA